MSVVDKLLLEIYAEEIESYALNSCDFEFFNSGEDHAQIVLTNIAKYSKEYIHIYSGNLCTDVSNNEKYISSLKTFLTNGGKINVLLCEFDNLSKEENPLNKEIYKLFSSYKENVIVKKTSVILIDNEKNPVHFTVADGKSYRLETDTKSKKARCNFNAPKISSTLNNLFLKVFNSETSETIQLNYT